MSTKPGAGQIEEIKGSVFRAKLSRPDGDKCIIDFNFEDTIPFEKKFCGEYPPSVQKVIGYQIAPELGIIFNYGKSFSSWKLISYLVQSDVIEREKFGHITIPVPKEYDIDFVVTLLQRYLNIQMKIFGEKQSGSDCYSVVQVNFVHSIEKRSREVRVSFDRVEPADLMLCERPRI